MLEGNISCQKDLSKDLSEDLIRMLLNSDILMLAILLIIHETASLPQATHAIVSL